MEMLTKALSRLDVSLCISLIALHFNACMEIMSTKPILSTVPDKCPGRLSALIILILHKNLLFLLQQRPLVPIGEVTLGGHLEVPLAEVGRPRSNTNSISNSF